MLILLRAFIRTSLSWKLEARNQLVRMCGFVNFDGVRTHSLSNDLLVLDFCTLSHARLICNGWKSSETWNFNERYSRGAWTDIELLSDSWIMFLWKFEIDHWYGINTEMTTPLQTSSTRRWWWLRRQWTVAHRAPSPLTPHPRRPPSACPTRNPPGTHYQGDGIRRKGETWIWRISGIWRGGGGENDMFLWQCRVVIDIST